MSCMFCRYRGSNLTSDYEKRASFSQGWETLLAQQRRTLCVCVLGSERYQNSSAKHVVTPRASLLLGPLMLLLTIKHFSVAHCSRRRSRKKKKRPLPSNTVCGFLSCISSPVMNQRAFSVSCRVEFAHTSGPSAIFALSAARPHTVFYLKTLRKGKGGTAIRHELHIL